MLPWWTLWDLQHQRTLPPSTLWPCSHQFSKLLFPSSDESPLGTPKYVTWWVGEKAAHDGQSVSVATHVSRCCSVAPRTGQHAESYGLNRCWCSLSPDPKLLGCDSATGAFHDVEGHVLPWAPQLPLDGPSCTSRVAGPPSEVTLGRA